MAEFPFMPFYVSDYLSDTTHLSTEQHGAYTLLLVVMWKNGGDLPDDDHQLANITRLSPTKWLKMRPLIISFFEVADGRITHHRLTFEREKAKNLGEIRSHVGKLGAEAKALKKKEATQAIADDLLKQNASKGEPFHISHYTDQKEEGEEGVGSARARDPSLEEAFDLWNGLAEEGPIKLAKAQVLTPPRRAKLGKRLAESGGLDGWKAALDKVRQSSFCHGDNDRGWLADLDFLLQQQSFTRLMEGKYDNRPRTNGNGKASLSHTLAVVDAIFDEADRREGSGQSGNEANVVELSRLRQGPS